MSDILREVGKIARSLSYISNNEFKEVSLDKEQYLYITRIYENPGIINDDLAEMLCLDRTTVSKSIRKLEKRELIFKTQDAKNKKIRRLFLTESAKELYHYLKKEEEYSERMLLQGFTADEKATLLSLLKRVGTQAESEWLLVRSGERRKY